LSSFPIMDLGPSAALPSCPAGALPSGPTIGFMHGHGCCAGALLSIMGVGQLAALPSCPTVGFPSSGIENAGITRMHAANNAINILTLFMFYTSI
jgi:hypothetical protein